LLASSRPRRPGACSPHGILRFRGDPEGGAEAGVGGPGAVHPPATSSRGPHRCALLLAPPPPWLRPPMPRICGGSPGRDTAVTVSALLRIAALPAPTDRDLVRPPPARA